MSVICQNFVQNAWKKDLCSNCFKSVGDHETGESHILNDDSLHSNPSEGLQVRYISKNGFHTIGSTGTPHTTWKSLISEKNSSKNLQPFNLEKGFQGRLLTINKASEKNSPDEAFTKLLASNVVQLDDLTPEDRSTKQRTNGTRNGSDRSRSESSSSDENYNGSSSEGSTQKNEEQKSTQSVRKEAKYSSGKKSILKFTKSKSEDVPPRKAIHGILKKTISNPPKSNSQSSRRGSNVGFKDEEPLVIGFGGRDFSPEELEFELNDSDCEQSTESLDETEDDRAFSTMTKVNTEFNSDNTNLLKMEQAKKVGDSRTTNGTVSSRSNATLSSEQTKQDAESKMTSGIHNFHESSNPDFVEKPSELRVTIGSANERLTGIVNNEVKTTCTNSRRNTPDNSSSRDPSSMAKGDKKGLSATPKKAAVRAKNSLEGGAVSSVAQPSRVLHPSPTPHSEGRRDAEDANNEWQEETRCGDEILQAINTSLANRHGDMSGEDNEIDKSTHGEGGVETPKSDGGKDASEANNGTTVAEPRASFLHGCDSTLAKPSAIYGPASDLFVSRSNSSSSSSSDDVTKSLQTRSVNVTVNGGVDNASNKQGVSVSISGSDSRPSSALSDAENPSRRLYKQKPRIPAKPLKSKTQLRKNDSKAKSLDTIYQLDDSPPLEPLNGCHYSVSNSSDPDPQVKTISLVDHYAETNIYQEVYDVSKDEKALPRESKLAALAMELEQVRQPNGSTKRQAPAPPKIPEPPLEDPPSNDRVSPLGFSTFRGESLGFSSSSSSAASTSSQDTEAGYASWTLNGDLDDHQPKSKSSKSSSSKSSFLQAQYSRCKMLAREYAEDRSRKKFSIKKLLKMRKDPGSEGGQVGVFDPSAPNPKAWKYSDHFERPRAKLEIIHPMDLDTKVLVNPGFESQSLSSFVTASEDSSHRNSVSSDYGSFYSDTVVCGQQEGAYDNVPAGTMEQEDGIYPRSASPTPSRSSSVSQASTLTSGSSKNDGVSPHRPPKPPPPPRAHSLLPGTKTLNSDGTYKFPVTKCNSVDSINIVVAPQAPKRQFKSAIQRLDEGIYGKCKDIASIDVTSMNNAPADLRVPEEHQYGTVLEVSMHSPDSTTCENLVNAELNQPEHTPQSSAQVSILEVNSETPSINVTMRTTSPEATTEKPSRNSLSRNKHPPITKAPARPPPVYMKPPPNATSKNLNPWKTLEESYLVLTSSNRELLIKLVNQSLRKRKEFLVQMKKVKYDWNEFEIDTAQPSSVFAFGEKIAYDATMPKYPESPMTLVVTVQASRLNENELKYPVLGQFIGHIPSELLDNSNESDLESMQATVLVLDQSSISTTETFSDALPDRLSEDNEKEVCFIVLQLIHLLKSLQAQGIETVESSFLNLILAKTKNDKYNTLVFLSDNNDESDYMTDSGKASLCQYALLLLLQLLNVQSVEEFGNEPESRFSSKTAKNVFQVAISLLLEEKAVSLSQTKTLFECFLWDVTKVIAKLDESEEIDGLLYRWLDVKRANFIKSVIGEDSICNINVQEEYYSQFLVRASVRCIKEVVSYL